MKAIIIRVALTLALIYGAYTETGKWTALTLLLIFTGMEATIFLIKKLEKELTK